MYKIILKSGKELDVPDWVGSKILNRKELVGMHSLREDNGKFIALINSIEIVSILPIEETKEQQNTITVDKEKFNSGTDTLNDFPSIFQGKGYTYSLS